MERRTVHLTIAGQDYRVVSSAPESELRRLALVVEEKVVSVVPAGRPAPTQAILLAAIALAHDLAKERTRRESIERRARDILGRVLTRIDGVLDDVEEDDAPSEGDDGEGFT